MEAVVESQHRTKVKLRKAGHSWVNVRGSVTPDIQSRMVCIEDGGGETLHVLTLRDLVVSTFLRGRGLGNRPATHHKKSDHLIVALKPGNSGGAKGVTG